MEFLLKSQKKHRNWVWLKQLLLLLSRIAALLLLLFALGQVGCDNPSLSRFLEGETTHHYVLIDDSFSMADKAGGRSVMDNAGQALLQIALQVRQQSRNRFTVLRYSRARRLTASDDSQASSDATTPPPSQLESITDIHAAPVDNLLNTAV